MKPVVNENSTDTPQPVKRSWFWSITESCQFAFVNLVGFILGFVMRLARGDFNSNWTIFFYVLSLFWALVFISKLLDEIRSSKTK